jgi:hypothetical protein
MALTCILRFLTTAAILKLKNLILPQTNQSRTNSQKTEANTADFLEYEGRFIQGSKKTNPARKYQQRDVGQEGGNMHKRSTLADT